MDSVVEHNIGKRHTRLLNPFLCLALFTVALYVRMLSYARVFSDGNVYLFDPDCYMRLRKIFVYINSFPTINVHDYFQGFPVGTGVISPPVMEYLIASIALLFGKSTALSFDLRIFVAILPPVVGALTVVLLYYFLSREFGKVPAVVGALVLSLSPIHIMTTPLGRFDNEMLETFLFLLVVLLYRKTLIGAVRLRDWLVLSVASLMFLLVWRGALFPLAIIGVAIILRLLSDREDRELTSKVSRNAACLYLVQALVVTVICLFDLFGTRLLIDFTRISWFHVGLFGFAAVLFSVSGWVFNRFSGSKAHYSLLLASCLLVGLLFYFVSHWGWLQGMNVFSVENPWLESISQYSGSVVGRMRVNYLLTRYGGAVVLIPIALLLSLYTDKVAGWKSFFCCLICITFAAAMFRLRFGHFFVLSLSLVVAFVAAVLLGWLHKLKMPSIAAVSLVLVVFPAMQAWTYTSLKSSGVGFSIQGDLEETLHWLRDETPSAGDSLLAEVKPDYAVLARWDFGGLLETVAERPSLATNYGVETHGLKEVAQFLLSENENEMSDVLKSNGVRYLLVDKTTRSLPMYAALIGKNIEIFNERKSPGSDKTVSYPTEAAFNLVSSRLYYADGTERTAGQFVFRPVENTRLVYESKSSANVVGFPWEIKKYKVFEYVDGAKLIVRGEPGEDVALSQWVRTNQGRQFEYRVRKQFDRNGSAAFRVTYAPSSGPETTGAVGSSRLFSTGQYRSFLVNSRDIETKRVLEINFL